MGKSHTDTFITLFLQMLYMLKSGDTGELTEPEVCHLVAVTLLTSVQLICLILGSSFK